METWMHVLEWNEWIIGNIIHVMGWNEWTNGKWMHVLWWINECINGNMNACFRMNWMNK